jgi:hypothetical protein
MPLIKTFTEYCNAKKVKKKDILPDVSNMPLKHRSALTSTAIMFLITEHLNDGWEPDWDNSNEYKYWPWFYMNKPGFRLDDISCRWANSHSSAGSRLCFRTRELAEHAAKFFLKEYEAMMILPKKKKAVRKK